MEGVLNHYLIACKRLSKVNLREIFTPKCDSIYTGMSEYIIDFILNHSFKYSRSEVNEGIVTLDSELLEIIHEHRWNVYRTDDCIRLFNPSNYVEVNYKSDNILIVTI